MLKLLDSACDVLHNICMGAGTLHVMSCIIYVWGLVSLQWALDTNMSKVLAAVASDGNVFHSLMALGGEWKLSVLFSELMFTMALVAVDVYLHMAYVLTHQPVC